MTRFLLPLFVCLTLLSCTDKFDEDVLLVSGIYEANIVGIGGPYPVSLSVDHGNDILIDAPFDGFNWILVEAKVKDKEDELKKIEIPSQEIGDDIFIEGEGIYFNYTIQLDYTIDFSEDQYAYSLIGSKL